MNKEIICGIYMLKDSTSGRVYIGSSINIRKRFREHLRKLQQCKHSNYKLQKAHNLSELVLELFILEECLREDLSSRENYWLRFYDAVRTGFNVTYDTRRPDSKVSLARKERLRRREELMNNYNKI